MCCRKGILLWQPIAKQKAGICLSENRKCTSNKKSGFFAAWLLVSFQSCACVRFEKQHAWCLLLGQNMHALLVRLRLWMHDQLSRGALMVMSPMCYMASMWFFKHLVWYCDILVGSTYSGFATWMDEDYIGRVMALSFAIWLLNLNHDSALDKFTCMQVARMSRRTHAFLISIRTTRRALMHYQRTWRLNGYSRWYAGWTKKSACYGCWVVRCGFWEWIGLWYVNPCMYTPKKISIYMHEFLNHNLDTNTRTHFFSPYETSIKNWTEQK